MKVTAPSGATAIIIGPPWPRGGTARVMQSQVQFYRSRGYRTVFVCVPLHCAFVESYPGWAEIKAGIEELGADRSFFASIDWNRFRMEKYLTWIRLGFQGTALDWIVFSAKSSSLSKNDLGEVQKERVAVIHVNHVFTLEFARRLAAKLSIKPAPLLLETHDIQAHALGDKGEINPWTHRTDSENELIASEIAYARKTKVMIHLSEDDFKFFQQRVPGAQHVLLMPTIDQAFVSRVQSVDGVNLNSGIDLLFVGQSTGPNCAAIKWFFEQVWPILAERKYRMKIVGQIGALVRQSLPEIYRAHEDAFVGPVEDLAPYYRAARCVFAPMVSGTGISIKTIEALALGKPFVGTAKAFRGMPLGPLFEAGLRAHDTAMEFAQALIEALSRPADWSSASSRAYARLFSQEASFVARDKALNLALSS